MSKLVPTDNRTSCEVSAKSVYDELFKKQGGVCATCHAAPQPKKKLRLDWDHKTGQVRGLLCSNCERAIACFNDDPAMIQRAAKYLQTRNGKRSSKKAVKTRDDQ